MIDPMATGTVKRPSADLRRPRGREALSTHPPTPVDDTPRGSLEQRAENDTDPRKTATWAWSKAETERWRHAAATAPTLAPIDAFPDEYSTADDLAAIRLDADPGDTGPLVFTDRGGMPLDTKQFRRLLERCGIACVPHGFRSSFRNWAAEETDHPREVIEAALAHVVQNKVEAARAVARVAESSTSVAASLMASLTSELLGDHVSARGTRRE